MAWFSKFKFLYTLKLNLNGDHFSKAISKFDYFKKVEKVKKSCCGWEKHWLRKWYSFEHNRQNKCEFVSALQKRPFLDLWSNKGDNLLKWPDFKNSSF